MFKFRKVRGPEQMGDAISTLEDSANRLESMVEIAQKEKSRLHLLVGNVSDRVDQIKRSALSFDEKIQKIDKFESSFKAIESEIQGLQNEAVNLNEIKAETTGLFEQFESLKSQLQAATAKIETQSKTAEEVDNLVHQINEAKSRFFPEVEAIGQKQAELLNKYDSFVDRLEKSEVKLQDFAKLETEFKKTSENIAHESARLSTWMEATEKMSEKLGQATEVFETTKHKVDNLHELVEFIESKTKSLKKQKELLKNAHIESGRANGLFWEIKSKLTELEQDAEKIRHMEMQANEFDSALKRIENRFDQINSFAGKVEQLLTGYGRLDEYARDLQNHHKRLGVADELLKHLEKQINQAKDEHSKLNKAQEQITIFIKRSEESQTESRAVIRQMNELMQHTERFVQRAPDIDEALAQIESIRKRALVLENKLMEAMATSTDINNQAKKADEVKKSFETFYQNSEKLVLDQKKELASVNNTITGLENKLKAIQAGWSKVPEVMDKLSEIEKVHRNLEKTFKSVLQREQTVMGLKSLMEQNIESFKEFEKTTSDINQKAADILRVKAELDEMDFKIKALSSSSKQLSMMGQRIEKTENEMDSLTEKFSGFAGQMTAWQEQSESIKTECQNIYKSHENLRNNIGEVMDLFGNLANMQNQAETKSRSLIDYFDQAEQKISDLKDLSGQAGAQSDEQIHKLNEVRESLKVLNDTQNELTQKVNLIEAESAKISQISEAITEKQNQMSSLSEKITILESKAVVADQIQQRFDDFERKFEKLDNDLKTASVNLDKMESDRKNFDGYQETIAGFEKKVTGLSEKVKGLDKLKKDISRASLMADELKARQKSLADEETLINKAITAASKLEELIYRAEHINEEEK